jgi:hypothetical protein
MIMKLKKSEARAQGGCRASEKKIKNTEFWVVTPCNLE